MNQWCVTQGCHHNRNDQSGNQTLRQSSSSPRDDLRTYPLPPVPKPEPLRRPCKYIMSTNSVVCAQKIGMSVNWANRSRNAVRSVRVQHKRASSTKPPSAPKIREFVWCRGPPHWFVRARAGRNPVILANHPTKIYMYMTTEEKHRKKK